MVVRPDRCKAFLDKGGEEYGWFQDQVCLAEHLLVGPFEFVKRQSPGSSSKMEGYQIEEEIWERLEVVGRAHGLSMREIHIQERAHTAMMDINVRPKVSEQNNEKPESK